MLYGNPTTTAGDSIDGAATPRATTTPEPKQKPFTLPEPKPTDATRHLIGVTAGLLAIYGKDWSSHDREAVSEAIRAARAERNSVSILDDALNGRR